jgi:hypothetical protein
MDRLVGHLRHFDGPELCEALAEHGCAVVRTRRWGFPCHSLYKSLISAARPSRLYTAFSGVQRYGPGKRLFSHLLYALFLVNDLFPGGCQLLVHARPAARGYGP